MRPLDERSYAFVVKIWEERRDIAGAGPSWRGSVDDVQTGTRHYFDSLVGLTDYLNKRSGMARGSRWRDRVIACMRRH